MSKFLSNPCVLLASVKSENRYMYKFNALAEKCGLPILFCSHSCFSFLCSEFCLLRPLNLYVLDVFHRNISDESNLYITYVYNNVSARSHRESSVYLKAYIKVPTCKMNVSWEMEKKKSREKRIHLPRYSIFKMAKISFVVVYEK